MPAIDDGRAVRLYGEGGDVSGSKEIIIGTKRADASLASGDKLASFCSDAGGANPSEKSYVDYLGVFQGTASTLAGAGTISGIGGTAGSGTGITVNGTSQVRSVIHKITADYTAFQTAGTTNDVTLWTIPAKTRVLRMVADVTTKFIGGAISACVMRVGKAANGAEYILDKDVFAAAVTAGDAAAEIGASLLSATVADLTWATTQAVVMRMTSTTANLSALTQGSVTLYIEVCTYP